MRILGPKKPNTYFGPSLSNHIYCPFVFPETLGSISPPHLRRQQSGTVALAPNSPCASLPQFRLEEADAVPLAPSVSAFRPRSLRSRLELADAVPLAPSVSALRPRSLRSSLHRSPSPDWAARLKKTDVVPSPRFVLVSPASAFRPAQLEATKEAPTVKNKATSLTSPIICVKIKSPILGYADRGQDGQILYLQRDGDSIVHENPSPPIRSQG